MKATVLIIENEAISALLLSRYMEKLGHEVVGVAASPKEALQMYYRHSPDVVVMDILLEAEINGIELAELFNYCPILFYSGVVDYDLIKEAEKIPNSLFVSKPANLEVVKHCLENLIEKASLGQ
jgi:CheY-like chemotaxis protein